MEALPVSAVHEVKGVGLNNLNRPCIDHLPQRKSQPGDLCLMLPQQVSTAASTSDLLECFKGDFLLPGEFL